ncbi:MAG: hypothetical protein ACUVS4_17290, partial [Chloroflexaceae bacterium]
RLRSPLARGFSRRAGGACTTVRHTRSLWIICKQNPKMLYYGRRNGLNGSLMPHFGPSGFTRTARLVIIQVVQGHLQ